MPIARRFNRALVVALLVTVPGSAVAAQALTPGTRVRVKSPQIVAPVTGSFQGMRSDTLVIIEDGPAAQVWSFQTGTIERLEVSAGMQGGNRGPMTRWGLIGAAVGAGAGLVASGILEGASDSEYNHALNAVIGAGLGAVGGVVYGHRKLEEHWNGVAVPRRVGFAPMRRGFRLGVSATF